MTQDRQITLGSLFAGGWRLTRSHGEVALLLIGLQTALSLVLTLPFMDWFTEATRLMQAGQAGDVTALEGLQPPGLLLPALLAIGLTSAIISIIWVRLIAIGRDAVLEGGLPALGRRLMLFIWRYICFVGLMIVALVLIFLGTLLFGLVIGVIIGALGGGQAATELALGIVSALIGYACLLPLVLALLISTTTTALDGGLGLLDSLQHWLKNWWPVTGIAIGMVILNTVAGAVFSLIIPSTEVSVFSLGLNFLLSVIFALYFYAVAVVWLDRIRD